MSQAIDRAFDLLDCFRERKAMSLTDLSERTGQSISTVHRIAAVLERRGVLLRDPVSHAYMIGPDIVALAARADPIAQIKSLARPLLVELCDALGETAVLSLLVGEQRVAIDQQESRHELRRRVDLGTPLALHYGSAGKAMLAHLEEAQREGLLRTLPPKGHTPFTPTNAEALRVELEGIRRRGYAVSKNEYLIGVTSIGAAGFDRDGAVVGSISVTGPLSRLTSNLYAKFGTEVADTAQRLTLALSRVGGADETAESVPARSA